jgi:hypothetical protein
MELGILAGLTGIGYLLNQRDKDNQFEQNNQQTLQDYLKRNKYQQQLAQNNNFGYANSCADSYPLYSPEYVKHQQRMLSGLPQMSKPKVKPEIDFKKHVEHNHVEHNHETFANFIPANDPTSEMLLDIKERPLTDFYHANMVPFYRGDGTKQNMAGTGVADGSYIDGSNVPGNITGINSGFDYSTPYQTQLATFTGNDDTYLHKREVGPMFSPAEQQTGWVYGTPLFRPDMDRYTQGLTNIRNDLRPVEPEMVGPGLNIDPSIPASGGFHDFTRILPNNVNDYKANQLPGQVITGKFYSAELPSAYPGIGVSGDKSAPGVTKNKPNSFWDQSRYPTMTTKVGFQANLDYNIPQYEVDFKPNNAMRDQISYGLGNVDYRKAQNKFNESFNNNNNNVEHFGNVGINPNSNSNTNPNPNTNPNTNPNNHLIACVNEEISIGTGPLGAHIPQTGQRSETYMSQDNNIRSRSDCNAQPIGNPERAAYGHGNIMANWYVNETDRGTVNPQNVMQLNLSAEKQGSAFWTATDEARTTTKETSNYSYHGNAERSQDGYTFYTYTDEPKTTTKDTTGYSYAGNTSRPRDGSTFYTYVDEPKTTTKDTTNYAYVGDATRYIPADTNRFMFMGNA